MEISESAKLGHILGDDRGLENWLQKAEHSLNYRNNPWYRKFGHKCPYVQQEGIRNNARWTHFSLGDCNVNNTGHDLFVIRLIETCILMGYPNVRVEKLLQTRKEGELACWRIRVIASTLFTINYFEVQNVALIWGIHLRMGYRPENDTFFVDTKVVEENYRELTPIIVDMCVVKEGW